MRFMGSVGSRAYTLVLEFGVCSMWGSYIGLM